MRSGGPTSTVKTPKTLVEVEGPQSIALDVPGDKMYWTAQEASFFSDGGVIQRADLNGGNAETLLTGLNDSEGIALDLVEGKMYWVHRRTEILRANLDGSRLESLVSSRAEALVLDVVSGKMYWTNKQGGSIHRADLDGENVARDRLGLGAPGGYRLRRSAAGHDSRYGGQHPDSQSRPMLQRPRRAQSAPKPKFGGRLPGTFWPFATRGITYGVCTGDAASPISYWTGVEVHDSRVKYISISEHSLHFEPRTLHLGSAFARTGPTDRTGIFVAPRSRLDRADPPGIEPIDQAKGVESLLQPIDRGRSPRN